LRLPSSLKNRIRDSHKTEVRMGADFYLFDVGHGQCAALRLVCEMWCIFDVGATGGFNPVKWIANNYWDSKSPWAGLIAKTKSPFYKATISHLHGDHLDAWTDLFVNYPPTLFRTNEYDVEYLSDSESSNSTHGWDLVKGFIGHHLASGLSMRMIPSYGSNISIRELSLSPELARLVGGGAGSRVNNASVVTRIDLYGKSILICGDMEKDAWQYVLDNSSAWRNLVSDINILVAPHHGHRSAYSVDLMSYAQPEVVLVSATSKDPSLDSRYSSESVNGITIAEDSYKYISTRSAGHIKVTFDMMDQLLKERLGTWRFGDYALTG